MSEQRDSSSKRSYDDADALSSHAKKSKPAGPPPKLAFDMPRKPAAPGSIKIGLGKPSSKIAFGGFKMGVQKSSSQEKVSKQDNSTKKTGSSEGGLKKAAAAFADDSEGSDEEEMPPEARMRMRNIGRDTPTSAGPNSFGKGKMGFNNHKKLYEKLLDEVAE